MNTAIPAKERFNLRLNSSVKRIIERAAALESKTVSSFILDSALMRAQKTIHQHETMTLSERDSRIFFDAMTAPVKFNDKLTAALEEHTRRVISK